MPRRVGGIFPQATAIARWPLVMWRRWMLAELRPVYRVRKRARDSLPKRITETRKRGEALVKAAKGLG